MKVRELMTKNVACCRADTNLARAGELMWENDCGVLPVVDEAGKVTGILTDRDICIALTTRDGQSSKIAAADVAISKCVMCEADDDIHSALKTMRREKVRRLPVVNRAGALEGILSLNDVVLRAEKGDGRMHPELTYDDVVHTFQGICAHRPGAVHVIAA
jgi:CBS domain-containing protein